MSNPQRQLWTRIPRSLWFYAAAILLITGVVMAVLRVWLPLQRERIVASQLKREGADIEMKLDVPDWIFKWVSSERIFRFAHVWRISFKTEGRRPEDRPIRWSDLSHLEELDLEGMITDDDLAQLNGLPHLTALRLFTWDTTDACMDHMGRLNSLRWLDFYMPNVTDQGFSRLKSLKELEFLNISGRGITNASLPQIASYSMLDFLGLSQTGVSDSGLVELKKLPRLQSLDLSYTSITNAAIPSLKLLTGLKRLCLQNTKITDDGIAELRRTLPGLEINGWWPGDPFGYSGVDALHHPPKYNVNRGFPFQE